jgi:hypothetical protein
VKPSRYAAIRLAAQTPVMLEKQPALKLLKIEPVKGYVGDSFIVSGEGFAGGTTIEFFWSTVEPSYITNVLPDTLNTTSASTMSNVSCWVTRVRMFRGG